MPNSYLIRLSPRQKIWFIVSVAMALSISVLGILFEPDRSPRAAGQFTVNMSIREIAPKLDVTGKGLARELVLPLETPKNKPLNKLGIRQEQLDHATAHILSHRSTGLKYYLFTAIVLFGLVYLTRLGRPDNANISERKLWYPRIPYNTCLLASVIVCGFVLGKTPNPMEGVVKVFKSMVGLYPSVVSKLLALLFFVVLAVIGNKLICGWACPFGALQELSYSLPILHKVKRWKAPFRLTNPVRGILFFVMFLFLFGIVGGRKGFVIYHYLNTFNLFNLDFDHWLILVTVIVSLTLAFFIYRPFCHLICPFGFVSWIAEQVSLVRVRVNHEKCTDCGLCIKACPTEAAKGRVLDKLFGADCFSCARCLNVCPQDAIRYCSVLSKTSCGMPQKQSASEKESVLI
jgi:ferredoxin